MEGRGISRGKEWRDGAFPGAIEWREWGAIEWREWNISRGNKVERMGHFQGQKSIERIDILRGNCRVKEGGRGCTG